MAENVTKMRSDFFSPKIILKRPLLYSKKNVLVFYYEKKLKVEVFTSQKRSLQECSDVTASAASQVHIFEIFPWSKSTES